jgi:hypothetical protein
MDLLLPIDHKLFHLPLARILDQSMSMKEAHLLGFKSAQPRLEASQDPDNLENTVNPDQRKNCKKKTPKKPKPPRAKKKW